MTTYTTLSDADLAIDKPITQAKLRALRDNPLAISEGDATAPDIAGAAIADGSLASDKLLAPIQGTSVLQLRCTTGTINSAAPGEFLMARVSVQRSGTLTCRATTSNSSANTTGLKVYINGAAPVTTSGSETVPTIRDVNLTVSKGDRLDLYAMRTGAAGTLTADTALVYTSNDCFCVSLYEDLT